MITIDRERNIYRTEDGTEYPSVSAIVSPFEHFYGEEAALVKGRAIHRACELLDGGGDRSGLDLGTLDPSLVGYVAAWETFKEAMQPHFFCIEESMVSEKWGFGGTVDRVAMVRNHNTVIDIKTGSPAPTYPIRLSAYGQLAGLTSNRDRGLIVYLSGDGRFSLEQVPLVGHWTIFRSMLAIYHWQRNGGNV